VEARRHPEEGTRTSVLSWFRARAAAAATIVALGSATSPLAALLGPHGPLAPAPAAAESGDPGDDADQGPEDVDAPGADEETDADDPSGAVRADLPRQPARAATAVEHRGAPDLGLGQAGALEEVEPVLFDRAAEDRLFLHLAAMVRLPLVSERASNVLQSFHRRVHPGDAADQRIARVAPGALQVPLHRLVALGDADL